MRRFQRIQTLVQPLDGKAGAVRTRIALGTGRSLRADRAWLSLFALRARISLLSRVTLIAFRARLALFSWVTLIALRARIALFSGVTFVALRAGIAFFSGVTLVTFRARLAPEPRLSGISLRTGRAPWAGLTLRARISGIALGASLTRVSLVSLGALLSLISLGALISLIALRTGRALRAGGTRISLCALIALVALIAFRPLELCLLLGCQIVESQRIALFSVHDVHRLAAATAGRREPVPALDLAQRDRPVVEDDRCHANLPGHLPGSRNSPRHLRRRLNRAHTRVTSGIKMKFLKFASVDRMRPSSAGQIVSRCPPESN